jgi:hypothetical protein
MAECLFCGAPASSFEDYAPAEAIEPPTGHLPFTVEEASADAAFRKFARSSFWYPGDLRSARLDLKRLLLPAWAWSGDAETHWAGLVRASTSSGKRPVAGQSEHHFDQILVPASQTLTLRELTGLGRYDESALAPFSDAIDLPYEISELTRTAAERAAREEMERRHRAMIASSEGTVSLNTASVVTGLDGRPVLVPVWIGAYRYGDRVYRVLVNGQSGALLGDAPRSVYKMIAVAALVLAVVGGLAACLGLGCLGASLGG